MTVGSLFSGIGGIDLGLERAGMVCKWQVEIDPFCQKVLAQHWPQVKRYGDIKTVGAQEFEPVDLIAGGFPCQDLSQAGKRAGIEGSRSGLWFEFARIIGELRPRYVLIENVPGLLVYDGMRRVLGELSRRGYDAVWFSVRASEFGASHLRKRVFIVAYRRGERRQQDARGSPCDETADGRTRRDEREPDGDNQPCGEGADVAHSTSGGRRELRESSRSNGLVNGIHAQLADAERARRDRLTRAGIRTDGQSLQAARSGESNGSVEDPGCSRGRRTQESAELDRRRASGDDSGTSGTLEDPARHEQPGLSGEDRGMRRRGIREAGEQLADARLQHQFIQQRDDGSEHSGDGYELADSAITRLEIGGDQTGDSREAQYPTVERAGAFAPGPADPRWPDILRERPDLAPSLIAPLRGVVDGLPDWLDRAMQDRTKRLSRLGNAVVPQIAEWIGRKLLGS